MSIKSFMSIVFTCTAAATFVAGTALAADIAETRYFRKLSPAVKCESSKLKESSKYSACRLKADAKAVRKDIAADYAKCEVKFADMWTHVENRAGAGNCPSEGDQASMDSRITTDVAEVATLLTGGTLTDCSGELATCNGDLGICDAGLTSCSGDLTICNTDLGTAQGSLSTCNGDLTNCNNVLVPAAFEDGEEAGCVAGGGSWDSGTCTAVSSYNCTIGAMCSAWAAEYPLDLPYYTNNHVGYTATSTGCAVEAWDQNILFSAPVLAVGWWIGPVWAAGWEALGVFSVCE